MPLSPHDKRILALKRAAKNPKYAGKVKVLIAKLKQRKATSDWLAQ